MGVDVKRVNIVRRLIKKIAGFVEGYIRRNKDGHWKRGSQLVIVSKGILTRVEGDNYLGGVSVWVVQGDIEFHLMPDLNAMRLAILQALLQRLGKR